MQGANAPPPLPPRIPVAPPPQHMTSCEVILYIIYIVHCYIPLHPVPNVPPPPPPQSLQFIILSPQGHMSGLNPANPFSQDDVM